MKKRTGPVRRSSKGGWTKEEDDILKQAVEENNGRNWKKIATQLPNRTSTQCLHRWQKVLDPNLIKGSWEKDEDEKIIELVKKSGAENWSWIASHLPGRIGKQCRERYLNHLDPTLKRGPWTDDEIQGLLSKQAEVGNKWAEIARSIPGRTDNACKNQYHSLVAKRNRRGRRSQASKKPIEEDPLTKFINSERAKGNIINPPVVKRRSYSLRSSKNNTAPVPMLLPKGNEEVLLPPTPPDLPILPDVIDGNVLKEDYDKLQSNVKRLEEQIKLLEMENKKLKGVDTDSSGDINPETLPQIGVLPPVLERKRDKPPTRTRRERSTRKRKRTDDNQEGNERKKRKLDDVPPPK